MTETSSNAQSRPDSLVGIVAAFEGIRDACTLLNGPLGCKYPLGYSSGMLAPHADPAGTNVFTEFYFGQSRVPCTYVDEQDFVYGTEEKIARALQVLDSKGSGLIGVVNQAGTSLIGDDLGRIIQSSKIKTRTAVVDSSGFTGTYADGFKTAAIRILESIAKGRQETIPKSVNIIGPSIFQYDWENDVDELRRMLGLLGIEVISVICAGETIANLERAGSAALNLVLYEEYGDSIANFLEREYGTPNIGIGMPSPFGLGPSEAWFGAVADFFHLSHERIGAESERIRSKCFPELSRISSSRSILRGTPFGIFGDSSQVVSLVAFFYEYLGLYPAVIGLKEVGPKSYGLLKKYMAVHSLDTSILINPDQYEIVDSLEERAPALVFGSSIEEHLSMMLDETPEFIPVSFPYYYEKTLLTMRPLIGFNGVLTLVEDILNSLRHYQLNRKNFLF